GHGGNVRACARTGQQGRDRDGRRLTPESVEPIYVALPHNEAAAMLVDELKKGTTPLLVLALLEVQPRHGYELSKLLDAQSKGVVHIHAASLYPLLYRLEQDGW